MDDLRHELQLPSHPELARGPTSREAKQGKVGPPVTGLAGLAAGFSLLPLDAVSKARVRGLLADGKRFSPFRTQKSFAVFRCVCVFFKRQACRG